MSRKLVLCPSDPDIAFDDHAALIELCRHVGLIGEAFDLAGYLLFRPGRNFLSLIHFARSHTVIKLEPSPAGLVEADHVDSRLTCRLEIPEFTQDILLYMGANDTGALCPNCAYHIDIDHVGEIMEPWFANRRGFLWECPKCHSSFRVYQLNWQHLAGFARIAIEVESIWRGKAVPSDELLEALAQLTGTMWDYLYLHS